MSFKLGMGRVRIDEICRLCGVEAVIYGNDDIFVSGIDTDSRNIGPEDIFVAVKGERYDGADFASSAVLSGATCVISTRPPEKAEELGRSFAYIESADPVETLSVLARNYKQSRSIKTVAVTGSVGKTTTKEMIASVLATRYNVGKTAGNLNTDIGLSLTVLGFDASVDTAVLEMGMSGLGEIERLSLIARPDYGVITNIGTSHIEYLKTRENIAKAKTEIVAGMSDDGVLVVLGDEPLLRPIREQRKNTVSVAIYSNDAEYRAENIVNKDLHTEFDLVHGNVRIAGIKLPVIGLHHVYGALFACAIGERFGLTEEELRRGLSEFKNAAMRQSITDVCGITVIDASYNASPESMRASLSVLCEIADAKNARKFALLGDMCELGDETRPQHEKLGEFAASLNLDGLITFGIASVCTADSAQKNGMAADKIISEINPSAAEECARKLSAVLKKGDVLLVKASRAMAAEKVIAYLKEHGVRN
ncbi:MAG: UDP-N-acetylmuramoyl-tripeptide--D-alanyl-D-alanine ligase [Ruminococcaceae bacterium]|nr:UDP-N-acetylmuramoyl-tripeptide--D-alanyl-D-alanine ligase [Oscillospiraceae bacterium]